MCGVTVVVVAIATVLVVDGGVDGHIRKVNETRAKFARAEVQRDQVARSIISSVADGRSVDSELRSLSRNSAKGFNSVTQ